MVVQSVRNAVLKTETNGIAMVLVAGSHAERLNVLPELGLLQTLQ